MAEELRPSNCHVVFEVFKENIVLALIDPDRPDAAEKKSVNDVIRSLAALGKAVIITNNRDKPMFVLPQSQTAEGVMREMNEELRRRFEADGSN